VLSISSIFYIYKSDCLYVCPLFTPELPHQSPPNFAQTSPPTQPLDPGVPQTLKPLCNVKCPSGWRMLIKFFPSSTGPGWLVINKIQSVSGCQNLIISQTAGPISVKFGRKAQNRDSFISLTPPPGVWGTKKEMHLIKLFRNKKCFNVTLGNAGVTSASIEIIQQSFTSCCVNKLVTNCSSFCFPVKLK